MAAAIQNCMHPNHLVLEQIVDGKGKSFREAAMIAVNNVMGSGVQKERINIREQRIEEIPPEPGFLTFVEVKTLDQVRFRFIEDLDFHRSFSRIFAFALSQSSNW